MSDPSKPSSEYFDGRAISCSGKSAQIIKWSARLHRPRRPLVHSPHLPEIGSGTASTPSSGPITRDANFLLCPIPFRVGDNILELNLTSESLSFSKSLGSVPNRGTTPQGDIFLNGVPYLQTVSDITIHGESVGIHVEPGIWIHVPSTTVPPDQGKPSPAWHRSRTGLPSRRKAPL
jgi:hypothetical protein